MNTFVLVSTFSRMKKYAPAIEAAMDCCWPHHPSIYFIGDCKIVEVKNQLCFFNACWTEILLRGLLALTKKHAGITHVFHMLDDHCPLRPCNTEAISAYLEIARSRDLAVVSFPTYEWPWTQTEQTDYPDGLIRMWRKVEVDIVDGRRLAIVPRDFFRYFQVQPAWWNINYLVEACRTALDKGIRDPWAFEAMRWTEASPHYLAEYNWPSVHHGFMAAGKVNHSAISYISGTAAAKLKAQLIRDTIGINIMAVYRTQRWFIKKSNGVRRILSLYREERLISVVINRYKIHTAPAREYIYRKILRQTKNRIRGLLPNVSLYGDFSSLPESLLLKASLDRALRNTGEPPDFIRAIDGMSGQKYRTFISNLVGFHPDARYLEIGSWGGSTASAALYGNSAKALCIDNCSLFGGSKAMFLNNIKRVLSPKIEFSMIEDDFRSIDYTSLGTFNIFLFDGPHAEVDQYDGIMLPRAALDGCFILIVDDWNWRQVRLGTFRAIIDARFSIVSAVEIRTTWNNTHPTISGKFSEWHNGYFVAVLKASG